MAMKIHLLTWLLLMSLAGCANSGAADRNLGGNQEKDSYQKEFISYADALNEYAKVMPVIGQDTEASWAASEVQTMRDNIAAGGLSVRENLAMIYRMQTMAAYGLAYESSIFALHSDESENAGYALHSLNNFDMDYLDERADGFQRDTSLCLLGDYSFFYSQLFATLYNELEHKHVFSTDAFGFSLYLYDVVRKLQDKGLGSSDILKVQAVLDGSSFFHAYVPLVQGFCISQEAYDRQYPVIIDAANFFDRYRQRMLKACGRGVSHVQQFLEKDFDTYVRESLQYRVTILGFLAENIKAIETARSEQQEENQ